MNYISLSEHEKRIQEYNNDDMHDSNDSDSDIRALYIISVIQTPALWSLHNV